MSKASLFNTGGWLFLYLFNTGGWVSLTRGATSVYHGGLPLFNTGGWTEVPNFRSAYVC